MNKDKKIDVQFKTHIKEKNIILPKQVSYEWNHDPKHLCFSLSRYKFVSKMFENMSSVLEVGAGDGFKSDIVSQSVKNLTLLDYTEINRDYYKGTKEYIVHNFVKKKLNRKFDGIYALDVLEHIKKKDEKKFIINILYSLKKNGILVFGCPSIESQKYASKLSKKGHVNCKNKTDLKRIMLTYFNCVLMFSMNDEVVHTGYDKMSHYIFAICTNKKIL